jgi:hypothetical protein
MSSNPAESCVSFTYQDTFTIRAGFSLSGYTFTTMVGTESTRAITYASFTTTLEDVYTITGIS